MPKMMNREFAERDRQHNTGLASRLMDSDDDDPEYMTPAQLQAHAKRIEIERRRAREAKEAQRST